MEQRTRAELLRDATGNKLTEPAAIERQVRRMLADDRAQAFISRVFVPWLQLDALAKADPDTKYFPDYDVSLRAAFAKETELFLLSQLREDRDPIELWNASYTFLNEQLARHYGVADVRVRSSAVWLSKPERVGLLGQGSVHMVMGSLQPLQPRELRSAQPHLWQPELRPHLQREAPARDAVRCAVRLLIIEESGDRNQESGLRKERGTSR